MTTTTGLGAKVEIVSAGTHVKNESLPPNSKAIQVASERGIYVDMIRTRAVRQSDFLNFDHVLAMDEKNLIALAEFQPGENEKKPCLLLDFSPSVAEQEITDPYGRGIESYQDAARLIEIGCRGFLAEVTERGML